MRQIRQREESKAAGTTNSISEYEMFQKVHKWLKNNQDLMQRHEPVAYYTSDSMSITPDKVKGVAYLIQRFGADLATT